MLPQFAGQIKKPYLHLSLDISEVVVNIEVVIATSKDGHQSEHGEAEKDKDPVALRIIFWIFHHVDDEFEHEDRPYGGDFNNGELSTKLHDPKPH